MTAPDDAFVVYDDRIHDSDCSRERPCRSCVLNLEDHIRAALAIHRPCHTATTPCERGHYGENDYPLGVQPAQCIGCGYDYNDQPVEYPCPTALALGVQVTAP